MTDDHRGLDSQIDALEAYIDTMSAQESAEQDLLAGKTDAEAILRRMQILLRVDKVSEAADLVRYRKPHERWCDQAIVAFVKNGENEEAKRIIEWADSLKDERVAYRCLLRYGETKTHSIIDNHESAGAPLPGSLSEEELSSLRDVLLVVQPVTDVLLARKRVDTELESRILQTALQAALFLQYDDLVDKAVVALSSRHPIPLALARVAFRTGRIEPVDLVERLRSEQPASFEAMYLAALIEGRLADKPADAFRSAMSLTDMVSSPEDGRRLFGVLSDLASFCGEKEQAEVARIAGTLLADDAATLQVVSAGNLLAEGKTEEAASILEQQRDESNAVWRQVYASYLIQKGDGKSAIEHLKAANEQLGHPDVYRRIAEVAYRFGQIDDAINALEELLSIQPHEAWARNNIAGLYAGRGDYRDATRHLKVLRELEPEEVNHHLNYALCLARSGDTNEAINVLRKVCEAEDPPLQAIIDLAELLRSAGQPQEAFDSLVRFKDAHWEMPAYLYELQELGFASGNEEIAGQALHQMQHLQTQGRVSPEALRTMDLDTAVEMIREAKEHQDHLHKEVVLGHLPWPMAEVGLKRVTYFGWLMRTQQLRWVPDDLVSRSSYAIYSTNGFNVREAEGHLSIEPIVRPEKGVEVVVDISSLITLHQLDLLDKAASFCGKIMVPAPYIARSLEDGSKLGFHQLSQKTSAEQIKEAIDLGQIHVAAEGHDLTAMPYVNDYDEDEPEKPVYRIGDVATTLFEGGHIDDEQYARFRKISHGKKAAGEAPPPLVIGKSILMNSTTLGTVAREGFLSQLVKGFRVHIEAQTHQELLADIRAITAQEKVQKGHSDLWKRIRNDGRFVQATYEVPEELKKDDGGASGMDCGFASILLSRQMQLPLLVDDRVLQRTHYNQSTVFGSNELIIAMGEAAMMTDDEVAEALMYLVEWRYRFLVLPASVLKTMADRYVSNPPGKPLRSISRYVHDCMRDPGLFLGPERTDPPGSVGLSFYQAWVNRTTEFVLSIWADANYSIEQAREFTKWALAYLLPSLPAGLGQRHRANVASIADRLILSLVLLRNQELAPLDRANAAVVAVAQALGMDSNAKYLRAITGVIDGI